MENNLILLDTSILIDFFRKTEKDNSEWMKLENRGFRFAISVISKYETLSGVPKEQLPFWNRVFGYLSVLSLDESCVDTAIRINTQLKRKRKQIDLPDLFIAATAANFNLPIATLNKKHFERVPNLTVLN
jgi:predicted nucleic acid-binding protein